MVGTGKDLLTEASWMEQERGSKACVTLPVVFLKKAILLPLPATITDCSNSCYFSADG